MDIFYNIHNQLPREGPGDDTSTARAFRLSEPLLPKRPHILDVGCGPGMQTLALARLAPDASIIGLDRHAPYLDVLRRGAAEAGVAERVQGVQGTMFDMPFEDESFDLIWSEGAIYIIGFEEGLRQWQRLLRPNGCIAVSELTWLVPDPPEEVRAFWGEAYPAMSDIAENQSAIADAGLKELGHFVLSANAWWEHYYGPMEARIKALRQQYDADPVSLQTLDEELAEIELYRHHSDSYGYVFYVMQR